jgi:hypothetical protein
VNASLPNFVDLVDEEDGVLHLHSLEGADDLARDCPHVGAAETLQC